MLRNCLPLIIFAQIAFAQSGLAVDPLHIRHFIAQLESLDRETRLNAAEKVKVYGRDGVAAIPALLAALNLEYGLERGIFLDALAAVGPGDKRVVAALSESVFNDGSTLTAQSLEHIGSMGASALPAMPAVLYILYSSKPLDAEKAVAGIGPAAAPILVHELGRTADPLRRGRLTAALAQLGAHPQAVEAVPHLVSLLNHPDPRQKRAGLHALRGYGDAGYMAIPTMEGIVRLTYGPDPLRPLACLTIGSLGKVGMPTLINLAVTGDVISRISAIAGMNEAGVSAFMAVDTLRQLRRDRNEAVATAAKNALQKLATSQRELQKS
jgi:HEAT repeat protein